MKPLLPSLWTLLLALLCCLVWGGCADRDTSGEGISGAPGAPRVVKPSDAEPHSIAIGGHLYSLYVEFKKEHPEPAIGWTAPMLTLSQQLQEIDPDLIFFLGDNTRYGRDVEWDFLEESFDPIWDRIRWGMGNHERRNMDAFLDQGGLVNRAIAHRGNKYIFLDCKTILEPHDLEFIREAVADHADFEHVFILTHFVLTGLPMPTTPLEELDPYEDYTRKSNWDRDVVPLIAGKVDAVISGDYNDQPVTNYVQELGPLEVQYIMTCFKFGRGDTPHAKGDGPMMFLELQFADGDFEVLPRIVPLDARHPWYGNQSFGRTGTPLPVIPGATYSRYVLPGDSVSLELAYNWEVKEEREDYFSAEFNLGSPWDYMTVAAGVFDSGSSAQDEWRELVLNQATEMPLTEVGMTSRMVPGVKVEGQLMSAVGLVGIRNVHRWGLLYEFNGTYHYLMLDLPESRKVKYSILVMQLIASIRDIR